MSLERSKALELVLKEHKVDLTPLKDRKKKLALDDEMSIQILYNLAKIGIPKAIAAGVFGMSLRTFQRRLSENPVINDAWNSGRATGIGGVYNTAYSLAKTGLDPQMTRWFVDKYGHAMEKEEELIAEQEDSVIDVTPGNDGPMSEQEILKRLKETYENDPMLKPRDDDDA